MKKKTSFDKLMSHLMINIEEEVSTDFHPKLEVTFTNGIYMLNGERVNHAYGPLDAVFRQAFKLIQLENRGDQDVLILGLGPGNVAAILEEYAAEHQTWYGKTGVEIDRTIIDLGRKYFKLGEIPHLKIEIADAVDYIQTCTEAFDLIIVDLFIEDQVPKAMETPEAIRRMSELLNPGGMLLFNRLMLTETLVQETEAFIETMKAELIGTFQYSVDRNRMVVWESPKIEINPYLD